MLTLKQKCIKNKTRQVIEVVERRVDFYLLVGMKWIRTVSENAPE